jgi:hypothetical protein
VWYSGTLSHCFTQNHNSRGFIRKSWKLHLLLLSTHKAQLAMLAKHSFMKTVGSLYRVCLRLYRIGLQFSHSYRSPLNFYFNHAQMQCFKPHFSQANISKPQANISKCQFFSKAFVTINLSQIYHLHEQNIFDIWNLSNKICSCKRGFLIAWVHFLLKHCLHFSPPQFGIWRQKTSYVAKKYWT